MVRFVLAAAVFLMSFVLTPEALAAPPCERFCSATGYVPGAVTAAHAEETEGGFWVASNSPPSVALFRYQLLEPCVVDDRDNGACRASDFQTCLGPPNRVIEDLVIERQRLAQPGSAEVQDGAQPGDPVGPWQNVDRACIDVTALNPPPSPAEIYRYFQTLPLPQLATQHQPPGNGLVGLPVIFYTDSATTQTFDLTIRGFQVQIVAGATAFTWHTGDGTELTSTTPGAPYPDHTISHDYRSGTYTAYVTVTWGATFSVNGSASVAVPGTTTTDGPPVTFTVLQARPVLTNPYD